MYITAAVTSLDDEPLDTKITIAENPVTRAVTLVRLYDYANRLPVHNGIRLKEAIASNPNTPTDILVKLARTNPVYSGNKVLHNIVMNPSAPQPMVEELLKYERIQQYIVWDKNAPEVILRRLLEQPNLAIHIAIGVYNHQNTTQDMRDQINEEYLLFNYLTTDFNYDIQDQPDWGSLVNAVETLLTQAGYDILDCHCEEDEGYERPDDLPDNVQWGASTLIVTVSLVLSEQKIDDALRMIDEILVNFKCAPYAGDYGEDGVRRS